MRHVSILAIAILASSFIPIAAADTCLENALCVANQQGEWGSGDCDDAAGYSGFHNDHRVYSPEVPYAYAYTYAGCAGYDDGTNAGKFSWLYANVMVSDPYGQLLLYANVGWSTYEFNGEGTCYASYFAWDAFTGAGSYGRPCSVGPVHPHPPVQLIP